MSSTTHPFTCNSCQVAFKSSDLQRTHMQSDWHRYNLKRRVASLPPLSSEIFAEKVLANKADAAATAARASFEKSCEPCGKSYFSENAYNNHLGSSKHKSNLLRLARGSRNRRDDDVGSVMSSTFSLGGTKTETETIDDESEDSESEEESSRVADVLKNAKLEDKDSVAHRPSRPNLSATGDSSETVDGEKVAEVPTSKEDMLRECLFCNRFSDDLKHNMEHMHKAHDLFIPERNYLVDPEGLLVYLNQKAHLDFQCLYCNKFKYSEDGIKQHMRDLGHCKIAYDTEDDQLEIGQFYDFRSTYSDEESDDDDSSTEEGPARGGGVKLGAKRQPRTRVENDGSDDEDVDDAGWETSSTTSSVPTDELGALMEDEDDDTKAEKHRRIKTHRHHAHSSQGKHRAADGWHSHAHHTPTAVYHDEYELHLPSGRIAGHRQLNRYFRQNLHNYPTPEERAQRLLTQGEEPEEETPRGRAKNRALVSRSDGGLGMIGVSDVKKKQVKAMEKKERKREGRMMAKVQWRSDVKGNSQKHYRDPLLQ